MAAKTHYQVLEDIKKKDFKSVYLLHGQENYFLDEIGNLMVETAIPEHEKGFNEVILYGKDVTIGDILNNSRRFPMMADRQLVYVREAHSIQDLKQKDSLDLLEKYALNPLESTILVLHFGKSPDARKAWVKAFAKKGEVVVTKKLYDNQVGDFISSYCKLKKLKITPKASQLLLEHVGNNLEAIAKEVDKIAINVASGGEVNDKIIEEYVGISKDYNVFELQKAITFKQSERCMQIVSYFAANTKDHPIQPVITMLYSYFTKVILVHASKSKDDRSLAAALKVNPYFVRDYVSAARNFGVAKLIQLIAALRIADKNAKGVDTGTKEESDIYKELIFSVLS